MCAQPDRGRDGATIASLGESGGSGEAAKVNASVLCVSELETVKQLLNAPKGVTRNTRNTTPTPNVTTCYDLLRNFAHVCTFLQRGAGENGTINRP